MTEIQRSVVERRLALLPDGATYAPAAAPERLTIDGVDLAALAGRYGTPLYVYDQATMDGAVTRYRRALAEHYPGPGAITYAGKAFLCVAVAQWATARGLVIDCTGEGELHIAAAAGVPTQQILLHGVNKSDADLRAGLRQAGTLVVDHLDELSRIAALWPERGQDGPSLWLRVRPGVAVETHAYRQTGQEDSKFGMSGSEARRAVHMCVDAGLPLTGVHFHQGSHFNDSGPVEQALDHVLDLLVSLRDESGWVPEVISPGGGWGVAYHEDDLPHPAIEHYVQQVGGALARGCVARSLPLPRLQVEPGRSLIARAGVALYRLGAVKESAGRRWLLLDGGMSDNIRPALYGARYSAVPVRDPQRPLQGPASLAGPICESGDLLARDLPMPELAPGELVAIPASGAYHLMMASNYNGMRRPAVVWLRGGRAHLIQQREELSDLVRRDLPLSADDLAAVERLSL